MSKPSPHDHGPSEVWKRPSLRRAFRQAKLRLGVRLRALRQARALTQEAAAEVIGIHPKHLQRVEAGTVNVTLATLVAIALSYGVPLSALWDESPVAG